MKIAQLDHLVLTVRDVQKSIAFYQKLGCEYRPFAEGRHALHFGSQKLNLHPLENGFSPCAEHPTPGSIDLCFLVESPIEEVVSELNALGLKIEMGPVMRTGACGPLRSVYIRDPDMNLVELSECTI